MQSPSQNHSQKLKIVVVGHVDHGKSTLIGRIFYDTDALPDGKIESIQKACEAEGMPFEYAFLLDALLEEQAQNITIDTTQIPFRTEKRGYVIIDAPGHTEFLKNMVTGAASADAALLVIAASEGVREQSRRHAYLLRLLGVKQVAVVVNKMDLANFEKATFDAIQSEYMEFLSTIGVRAERFIPVSARGGDNVARKALDTMPWYDGPTVLEALDTFSAPATEADLPLRLPLQDVYRFDERRILAGRIESGTLHEGDLLRFAPGNKTARVRTIERWKGKKAPYAVAGESVGITLDEQLFVERGHVAFLANDAKDAPLTTSRFQANLFWMGTDGPLQVGQTFRLKLATQETDATLVSVEHVWDAGTLAQTADNTVNRNDVAEITLQTRTPLVLDAHERVPNLGRFVLVQNRRVAGGGIILGAAGDGPQKTISDNLVWSHDPVSPAERASRNGHKGMVVWLTGLSGSGKSTIAQTVSRALFEKGWQAVLLDGDNLRHGLCANLGFGHDDRIENNRRAAHVAALMAASGGQIVLASLISPTVEGRDAARRIAEEAGVGFVEAYAEASLDACEARDPKGLYQKARAGQIQHFTGIDAPYEAPVAPDVRLSTGTEPVEASAQKLLDAIIERAQF